MGSGISKSDREKLEKLIDGAKPYTPDDPEYHMLDGGDFHRVLATMLAEYDAEKYGKPSADK